MIEAKARYTARWTDGFLENKFSRVSRAYEEEGRLVFHGNKVEFMNGVGGWQQMSYRCVYDPIAERALRVVIN